MNTQGVLGGLGGALLLAGQVAIFRDHYSLGIMLSVAGVALGAGGFVLPMVPWGPLKSALADALAWRPKRSAAASAAPASRRSSRGKAGAEVSAAVSAPSLPWRPFANDTLSFSRNWLWLPMGLIALHSQMLLTAGSVPLLVAELLVLILLATLYLQNLSMPITLPHMNDNVKTLLQAGLGMPFQIWGVWLLWQYVHIWKGYGLIIAGSSWMIWVLMQRPLNFVEDEASVSNELNWLPQMPWLDGNTLPVKAVLVTASVVCAYLAVYTFAGRDPGWAVSATFAAMLLLIASFPWFPSSVAEIPSLPEKVRGGIVLMMAAGAFFLGVRGQAMIDMGNLEGGLYRFLAGGILLVLGLRHHRASNDSLTQPDSNLSLRLEMLLVLVLFLSALQFRAFNLNIFPYGAEGDEAGGGVYGVDVLKHRYDNPLVSNNVPLHFFSITALFFKVFGVSVGAMRAHSAIFGTLSVLTTYFFLRLIWGSMIAFLATALMSFSYWHLHYSRFGHDNIVQVCLQMAAFYFVFKAMKDGGLKQWLIGGLAFGLAMMPHLASRLLPIQGIVLVLYLLLKRRDLLRRHLGGFIVFVLAAWIMAAPAVTYWFRVIPMSMGRAQSVSIFDKTNSNAPVDTLSGFVRNSKVTMMMFNHFSDSRTRNNPVAPQKILENWTAILFALSFVYLLYHWRNTLAFFLLSAFFINLSASVFAVEAPQTLRTAGNISLVFCMIAFMLYDLRGAFELLGKKRGTILFALILAPATAFFSYRSWQKYFVEARNLTFDTVPTYVAQAAGQNGGAADQAVFFATGFAASHPPVLLFAENTPIRNFYNVADYLPISTAGDRKHILFLCDVFEPLTPWVQQMYPKATVKQMPNLTAPGQDIATMIIVSKEELAASQGLAATVSVDGKNLELAHTDLAYPSSDIPKASHIRWKGSVRNEAYGLFMLQAKGRGNVVVKLGGQVVYTRMGGAESKRELRLPLGVLPIEVDYTPAGNEPFELDWSGRPHPARVLYSLRSPASGKFEKRQLSTFPVQGVYGQYYTTRNFKGDSVMEYVEPTVVAHWLDAPVPGAWSGVWRGKLRAPKTGNYRFTVNTFGSFAEVLVDGRRVHRSGAPPEPEMSAPKVDGTPLITAGVHEFEVRFYTPAASWWELRWTIPGEGEQLLLPQYLSPVYPRF